MLWMEAGRGGMGNLEGLGRNDQNLYKDTQLDHISSISCTQKSKQQPQQQQAHKRNQTKVWILLLCRRTHSCHCYVTHRCSQKSPFDFEWVKEKQAVNHLHSTGQQKCFFFVWGILLCSAVGFHPSSQSFFYVCSFYVYVNTWTDNMKLLW